MSHGIKHQRRGNRGEHPGRRQVLRNGAGGLAALLGLGPAVGTADEHEEPSEETIEELRGAFDCLERLSRMPDAALTVDIRRRLLAGITLSLSVLDESDELDDGGELIEQAQAAGEENNQAGEAVAEGSLAEVEEHLDATEPYLQDIQETVADEAGDHVLGMGIQRLVDLSMGARDDPFSILYDTEEDDGEAPVNVENMETFLDLMMRVDRQINRVRDAATSLQEEGFNVELHEESGALRVTGSEHFAEIVAGIPTWAIVVTSFVFAVGAATLLHVAAATPGILLGWVTSAVAVVAVGLLAYHSYTVIQDEYDSWGDLIDDIEPIVEPLLTFLNEHVLPPLATFRDVLLEQLQNIEPEDLIEPLVDLAQAVISAFLRLVDWLTDMGFFAAIPDTLATVWERLSGQVSDGDDGDGGDGENAAV